MITMIKTSLKLLLRTKAFWFFLILTPVLSTLVLKSKFDSSAAYVQKDNGEIIELAGPEEKVAYNGSGTGEYLIKVYDASASERSEAVLLNLARSGMYLVCRADLSKEKDPFTKEFLEYHLKQDGFEDRMGAAIYIYPGFETAGSAEEMAAELKVYALSEDERTDLLISDLEFLLGGCASFGDSFTDSLETVYEHKSVIRVSGKEGSNLSITEVNQKTQIGYSFAFLTLGFLFCGIFVAHTSIKEQKNGVLTRIGLTKSGPVQYFAAKFVTTFLVSCMVTAVMGVCTLIMTREDLGMSHGKYLVMIFLLGLIFSSVSMLIGTLMGDVMGSNVAAFFVWCMSALLSGLYFPLDDVSDLIRLLGSLMPQKWFLKASELIITGDNSGLFMVLYITAAYLLVVISLGSLGIKLRRTSEWGNS